MANLVDLIVSNEMLKAGQGTLLPILTKLFNLALSSGIYPDEWTYGRILPLHKSGDRSNPSNYRGITISSCIGKLFNAVLNNRLYDFLEKREILNREQIGFKRKHRTSDHLFVLRNLIDKYRRSRKPLYLLFVDFRKAFDKVWHTGLFYKLSNIGVASKFYTIIKNMYSKVKVSVVSGDMVSPLFKSRIGVRQGDNLSPTLFNIFVNDIPDLFKLDCSPPKIGDLSIPCLLYADDLVILSESTCDLQKALNRLEDWCKMWALDVNTSVK